MSSVRQWIPCAWLPFDDGAQDAAGAGAVARSPATLDLTLHPCAMAFKGHHRSEAAILEVLLPAVLPSALLTFLLPIGFGFFCRWLSSRTEAHGYSSEGFLSPQP